MKETKLCAAILEIEPPYRIDAISHDEPGKRLDIRVTGAGAKKSRLFVREGSGRHSADSTVWRHVNLGGLKCYVHVDETELPMENRLPWAGRPGSPFTRSLEKFIVELFTEGLGLTAVCRTLDLDVSDIWRLKHSLPGSKSARRSEPSQAKAAEGQGGIPAVTHPSWMKLVNGELDVQIDPLSLRLLIRRLQVQLQGIPNQEQKLDKLDELRRFFVKYQHTLSPQLVGIFQ